MNTIAVRADGIRSGDLYLDSVEIGLDGKSDQQLATINLALGEYRAEIGLEGRVLDWTRLTEAGWEGHIKSLEIHNQVQQLLGLDSAADMAFDGDNDYIDAGVIAETVAPETFSISLWFNRAADRAGVDIGQRGNPASGVAVDRRPWPRSGDVRSSRRCRCDG